MRSKLVQHMTVMLTVLAFLTGALGRYVPQAMAAQPCAMMMAGSHDASAPAKTPMPICDQAAACVVYVDLQAYRSEVGLQLTWTPVHYRTVWQSPEGLSLKPELTPPIVTL